MYKDSEYEFIYNEIYNNKMVKYKELEPFKDVLLCIFEQFPLFTTTMNYNESTYFVKNVVDLIINTSYQKLNCLNNRLLHMNSDYDTYLHYLRTLLIPNVASNNTYNYLFSFAHLFETEISVLAAQVNLSKLNCLNEIMEQANYELIQNNYDRLIVELVTACVYANKDMFGYDTVNKFYNNYHEYTDHLFLNYPDLDKKTIYDYLYRNSQGSRNARITLCEIYKYLLKTLYNIKKDNKQKVIK